MSILIKSLEMPQGDEMLCINIYPDGKVCIDLDLKCKRIATAVPVVRCKECKHFKRDIPCVGGTYNGCDELEGMDGCEPYVKEDFFCAYGERKDDEVE